MRLMKTAVAVLAMCSAGAPDLVAAVNGQTIRRSGSDAPAQRAFDGLRSIGGSRIGASVRDVDAEDVKERKLASESGAVLSDVDDDAPASRAGLEAGDVIVEYDGERVRSARQLTRLVQETPSGRKVGVVVSREGSRMAFTVEPEAGRSPSVYAFMTPPPPPAPPAAPRASFGGRRLGVSIQSLGDQLATHFGAKDGVLVTEVHDDSVASKAGIRAGDVITKVDGRDIDDTGDVMRALARAKEAIEIEIVRDRKTQTLKATLEDRDPASLPAGGSA